MRHFHVYDGYHIHDKHNQPHHHDLHNGLD